jgi:tetratricopeptide (TPR) repeat protein
MNLFMDHVGKKRLIVGFIFFILTLTSIIMVFLVLNSRNIEPQELTPLSVSRNKADSIAATGDIDGASAEYDKMISSANSPQDKSTLLIGKASLSYDSMDYAKALTYAKEAEVLYMDENVAQFTARTYLSLGDSENAIVYFKKAIELVDKNSASADIYISRYNYEIQTIKDGMK